MGHPDWETPRRSLVIGGAAALLLTGSLVVYNAAGNFAAGNFDFDSPKTQWILAIVIFSAAGTALLASGGFLIRLSWRGLARSTRMTHRAWCTAAGIAGLLFATASIGAFLLAVYAVRFLLFVAPDKYGP